jgi:hypothetical protein
MGNEQQNLQCRVLKKIKGRDDKVFSCSHAVFLDEKGLMSRRGLER